MNSLTIKGGLAFCKAFKTIARNHRDMPHYLYGIPMILIPILILRYSQHIALTESGLVNFFKVWLTVVLMFILFKKLPLNILTTLCITPLAAAIDSLIALGTHGCIETALSWLGTAITCGMLSATLYAALSWRIEKPERILLKATLTKPRFVLHKLQQSLYVFIIVTMFIVAIQEIYCIYFIDHPYNMTLLDAICSHISWENIQIIIPDNTISNIDTPSSIST